MYHRIYCWSSNVCVPFHSLVIGFIIMNLLYNVFFMNFHMFTPVRFNYNKDAFHFSFFFFLPWKLCYNYMVRIFQKPTKGNWLYLFTSHVAPSSLHTPIGIKHLDASATDDLKPRSLVRILPKVRKLWPQWKTSAQTFCFYSRPSAPMPYCHFIHWSKYKTENKLISVLLLRISTGNIFSYLLSLKNQLVNLYRKEQSP